MKIRKFVVNAVVASVYVVITALISPIAFGPIQGRVSEMLNHLGVYHKDYKWGVVLGVFIANLLFSPMKAYDLVFGTGQTLLSFLVLDQIFKRVTAEKGRMVWTTVIFSLSMAIIAWEIVLTSTDLAFWPIYLSTALSEAAILAATAPVMMLINRAVKFKDQMLKAENE